MRRILAYSIVNQVGFMIAGMAVVVLPFARRSIGAEIAERQHYLFYTMFLLCLSGLLGMTVTGDVFNVFVFLEISSLSTYVLIAMGRDRRALLAGYQYLIMGTIGATSVSYTHLDVYKRQAPPPCAAWA